MFLLNMKFLTLYVNGFLIGPARLCSSLPTVIKFSNVVLWPVLDWCSYTGEDALMILISFTEGAVSIPNHSPTYCI